MIETLKKLFLGTPDPRLEQLAQELSSATVSRGLLTAVYDGKNVSVLVKPYEISVYAACASTVGFEAKNRTWKTVQGEMPTHASLPENVKFFSYQPQQVQTWLDGLSDVQDLLTVFAGEDVELEMKPHKQRLQMEWEKCPTGSMTQQQIKDLLLAVCRVARSLES